MNNEDKLYGIVVAIKANYLIVELQLPRIKIQQNESYESIDDKRFLCTVRQKLLHNGLRASVGDIVLLEAID